MKTKNQQEKEALEAYDQYWESYIKGDIDQLANLLAEDYSQIGSVENEVFFNKPDAIQFMINTIDQVVDQVEMRNRKTRFEKADELVLVVEQCDLYVLIDSEWNFYSKFRASTLMKKIAGGWKIIHQHSSLPDSKTQEGENIAIAKISEENLQLQQAIKRRTTELENKNRELEIEAALEKVRAVSMSMRKPSDMLQVCRVISDQLQHFGVKHVRNIQTVIVDENIGQYLCYQYFTAYEDTVVEKTEYLKNPIEHEMVKQMLTSRNGHFIGSLNGEELEKFRSHRKREQHFQDPLLDEANDLSYCFLSIGEGGLGLSLYEPLTEEVFAIFKRFYQVFLLAYQRFRDIQKAEAQARESEIQLALERVRARSMAMQKSDELKEVIRWFMTNFFS